MKLNARQLMARGIGACPLILDVEKYAAKIVEAERALGPLSTGQRVDLLLDNFPELRTADEARALVQKAAPMVLNPPVVVFVGSQAQALKIFRALTAAKLPAQLVVSGGSDWTVKTSTRCELEARLVVEAVLA